MDKKSLSFRCKKRIISRIINNELLIIDLDSGKQFSLNQSGTSIWKSIATGKNLDSCILKLAQKYHVSPEKIKKDASLLIKDLSRKGLIYRTKEKT